MFMRPAQTGITRSRTQMDSDGRGRLMSTSS